MLVSIKEMPTSVFKVLDKKFKMETSAWDLGI